MPNRKSPPNKTNFIGKSFGKLTVIEDTGRRTKNGLVIYKCLCDCGNYTDVSSNHLSRGSTKSCGCLNHAIKDLSGLTFGRLKVISYNCRKKGYTWWNCKCSCGKEVLASSASLQRGTTKSCGCLNDEVRRSSIADRFGFVGGTSKVSISEDRKINKNNTSGYKGISYDKKRKKWVAQITFKKKNHHLGRYDTLEEAIAARKKAEETYFDPIRKV